MECGYAFHIPNSAFVKGQTVANQLDVIVLGGGPAGYVAAILAATWIWFGARHLMEVR